jgi:hypothetical protein
VTPELLVEIAAAGLASWAAWRTIPRPPQLDPERLFKVTLATLLRGEVEQQGGDLSAWEARLRAVPYHPAGRDAERRLADPTASPVPVPALPGERALLDRLAAQPDATARWDQMYRADAAALDALMSDPAELGPDYDPVGRFGPEATWDAVAAWAPAVQAGLTRRLSHVAWVEVGAGLGAAWSEALPALRRHAIPAEADDIEALDALEAATPAPSDRLVLVSRGPGLMRLLRLLHGHPALRDRTLVVLSLGGPVTSGPDDAAWVSAHFTHEQMEPELQRAIVYGFVTRVDPAAPLAASWAAQRLDTPPIPASGRKTIEAVDLGPLDTASLPPLALARALCLWVATVVAQ